MPPINPLEYHRQIGLAAPSRMPGPNKPCWCGSGKKYKKCHRDRETEAPSNVFADSAKMRSAGRQGKCLHPDAGGGHCSSKAIASHTVQRSGGLSAIAENGHILTTFVGFDEVKKAEGKPEPKSMGVKEASTFPGFCSKHDAELFKPIEGSTLNLGPKEAFLFLYRAQCLELARKRTVVSHLPVLKKMDAGQSLDHQLFTQDTLKAYEQGLTLSLTAMEARKVEADRAYLNSDWTKIHYCQIEFDGVLPVTTTCAFYPEFDWAGNALQDLLDLSKAALEIGFSITSYAGRSSVIFVWHGEETGVQRTFVDSFLSLPDGSKAERIVPFCFEVSENSQIKPSWWNALPTATRRELSDKIFHGTSQEPHKAAAMADVAPLPTAFGVKHVVKSWA